MISALWHKSKFNFELFWKIIQIFGFPCCRTIEDLSIDASITNEGLILTISSVGVRTLGVRTDGRTDRVLESSYGNKLVEITLAQISRYVWEIPGRSNSNKKFYFLQSFSKSYQIFAVWFYCSKHFYYYSWVNRSLMNTIQSNFSMFTATL